MNQFGFQIERATVNMFEPQKQYKIDQIIIGWFR